MKRLSYTIPVIVALYFTCSAMTCGTSCPEYEGSAMTKWLPYAKDQEIVFTDGLGGRDVLHIAVVDRSPAKNYKQRTDVVCTSSAEISSAEFSSVSNPDLRFIHKRTADGVNSVFLALHGFNINALDLSDKGVVADPSHPELSYTTYLNYTLGNHTYPGVQCITAADTAGIITGHPYKLYLAQDHGIVGYELYPSRQVWMLQ